MSDTASRKIMALVPGLAVAHWPFARRFVYLPRLGLRRFQEVGGFPYVGYTCQPSGLDDVLLGDIALALEDVQ